MRFGKDLNGKAIITINDGRNIGAVKDIYVNETLGWITGIYVGSEGLIRRKPLLIDRDHVVVFGVDAILVDKADIIREEAEHSTAVSWIRLDDLRGREVDTPGGTKVGAIDDIIIGAEAEITGFALGRVYVEGPIAERAQIPREAMIDTGNRRDDKVMTIDLPKVEALYQQAAATTAVSEEE